MMMMMMMKTEREVGNQAASLRPEGPELVTSYWS